MKSKLIAYKAWQIADAHRKLVLCSLVATFFIFIVGIFYFLYHGGRIWSLIDPESPLRETYMYGVKSSIAWIFSSWEITAIMLVILAIFLLGYFTIPVITEGAIISIVAKITREESFRYRIGFYEGFQSFWRLTEYHILTAYFSPIVIIFLVITFMNATGIGFWSIWHIFAFIFIITSILSFLFTFSEFFIVLHRQNPIEAIMKSTKLVIFNLDKIFFIIVLIGWIIVRTFFNLLIFLLFPLIIIGIFYLLATYFSLSITIAILAVSGIFLLLFMLYLFSFLYILKTIIWQLLFQELLKDFYL